MKADAIYAAQNREVLAFEGDGPHYRRRVHIKPGKTHRRSAGYDGQWNAQYYSREFADAFISSMLEQSGSLIEARRDMVRAFFSLATR